MSRRAAALVCVALAGCAEPDAQPAAGGPPEPVTLAIHNASEGPLRCVVVLAHFVTRDVAAIAPGATLSLAVERDPAAQSLAYGRHRDEPMMVENILCGATDAWALTRADIPLTSLRAGTDRDYRADCALAGRVTCTLAGREPVN